MKSVVALIPRVLVEVRSAWRFRWFGAVVAWLFCVLGWTVTAYLPDIYEASTTIYVDPSSVLRPILANQIVPQDVVAELNYVNQSLLGREHLERVARENGLDAGADTPAKLNAVLGRLLGSMSIETRPVSSQPGNLVATIRYQNEDRDKAMGVVTTLSNSLVDGTLGATQEGVDTAERFLDERIDEYEGRLRRSEQALADFKKENASRLPGAEGGYYEQIRAERFALEAAEKALRLGESKLVQIRGQLTSSSPVMPVSAVEDEPAPNSIDARIRDYRAQLDRLLLDFTERHPDVISIREALGQLEQQRAAQLRVLGVLDAEQEIGALGSNPVYQALQIALNETQIEIAALQADVGERTRKLQTLQALVNEVPQVEAELVRLSRDYEVVYQQYQSLVRSRETQALSVKAADSDQVQFRVLNPPFADFQPVGPHRLLFLTVVLALGVGGGAVLCWMLALLRPVFTSPSTVREVLGLPIVGVVSQVFSRGHRIRRMLAVGAFSVVMGVLGMIFLLAAAYELQGRGIHALVTGV
jgi:polysaccharide chain length determinant protein (PEP-CTERM system associated)